MAKRPTVVELTGAFGSQAALNTSLNNIAAKFDTVVSRDGSTPNSMQADLDMDSNDLLNAGRVQATSITVGGVNLVPDSVASVPDWEGAWQTATDYVVNDIVREDGNVYICIVAHTSGTFSTDLGADKWELFVSKGASGAGSGDLVSTNDLSDVDDVAQARTNLGLAIGSDVQAYDALLDAISDIDIAANEMLYGTGANEVSATVLSAFARTLLDDADSDAARATLEAPYLRATAYTGDLDNLSVSGIGVSFIPLGVGASNHWNVSGPGDFVLHMNFDSDTAIQIGFEDTGYTTRRQKVSGSWNSWLGLLTEQRSLSGSNSTWADQTSNRTHSTIYQAAGVGREVSLTVQASTERLVQVSSDNFVSDVVTVATIPGTSTDVYINFTVPKLSYYRINGACTIDNWAELKGLGS